MKKIKVVYEDNPEVSSLMKEFASILKKKKYILERYKYPDPIGFDYVVVITKGKTKEEKK